MSVAAWLLKIIIGFISERILLVAYKRGESEEKYMPEGGPQGTVLNLVCYYIAEKSACYALFAHFRPFLV